MSCAGKGWKKEQDDDLPGAEVPPFLCGSYKITTLVKADGSTTIMCSITIPGGIEINPTLPNTMEGLLKLKTNEEVVPDGRFLLQQPV
jgi:hypothetical protein